MIKHLNFTTIGCGTLILMLVSLYNGYPLVYSDTGCYIGSGFDLSIPPDRPIMYGLFIKFFSLSFSLWFVVLVQNFITSFLIHELFKLFRLKHHQLIFFLTVSFLTLFTSIAWYSNQIMPDFFTPLLFISFFLMLFNQDYLLLKKIVLSSIIIFASTTHLSNLLIGLFLVIYTLILYFKNRKKEVFISISLKKIIGLSCVMLSGWLVLILVNYSVESKPIISKGSHVFLMGNLIEKGILKRFLDEKCPTEEYRDCKFCEFKDHLPIDGATFIWGGDILEKTGGWIDSKPEYNKIIIGTFTQTKYLFDNIYY